MTNANSDANCRTMFVANLELEARTLRQRAMRAHQICNLLRIAHPEIGELGDDGCLHEAIHDILRVSTALKPNAQANRLMPEGENDGN